MSQFYISTCQQCLAKEVDVFYTQRLGWICEKCLVQEKVDQAVGSLLIELAFIVPSGTDLNKVLGPKLEAYKAAIEHRLLISLTPEQIHSLCHNLPSTVSREEFEEGCRLYQDKLYGPKIRMDE